MTEKKEKKPATLHDKLVSIQSALKVPKSNLNKFGGYKYRSNENILQALKPHLEKYGLIFRQYDEIIQIGERYYIKATSELSDGKDIIANTAYAREALAKRGMDESQISGTASSYARKYSANGLFLLDDTADADTTEFGKENQERQSERDKKCHNHILGQFGRCENEADVNKVMAGLEKQDWFPPYKEFAQKEIQKMITKIFNKEGKK